MTIEISDCYEYSIQGKEIDVDFIKGAIYYFTGINISSEKELFALENVYCLIEKEKVIEIFEEFDDFVKSNYEF